MPESRTESSPSSPREIPPWVDVVLLAAIALTFLMRGWITWPDPVVDFGRELYVPWQISEGRSLYADIACHNGPFSPYFNALLFSLFGVGLRTLVWVNAAIATGVMALVYRVALRYAGRLAAFLACASFITLFCFAQFTPMGNFNWLCPYSHELTHGIALALAGLVALHRAEERQRWQWALAAGGLLGCVFLGKCEVFAAAAVANVAFLVMSAWRKGRFGREDLKGGGALAVGFAAVLVVVYAYFLHAGGSAMAVRAVLGAWWYVFDARNASSPFFAFSIGTDAPLRNVLAMLKVLGVYALVFGGMVLVAWNWHPPRWRRRLSLATGAALLGGVLFARRFCHLGDYFRPLPVLLMAILLWGGWRLLRKRSAVEASHPAILSLGVFALLLLLKILLNCRIYHYGFALAMPAVIFLVCVITTWGPWGMRRLGGNAGCFLLVWCLLWGGVVWRYVKVAEMHIARKEFVMGAKSDSFLADIRCLNARQAAVILAQQTPSESTLVTLPDCEWLNYLARRRNPLPYGNFNPHQVGIFGEENMIRNFSLTPPDYVAIVDSDTASYGARFFGQDYAVALAKHIESHYKEWLTIGAPPFGPVRMGIRLLRRRDLPPSARN
jgi:hypothetical protein